MFFRAQEAASPLFGENSECSSLRFRISTWLVSIGMGPQLYLVVLVGDCWPLGGFAGLHLLAVCRAGLLRPHVHHGR